LNQTLVLAVAAFSAGALNTIAGGGTFLTFPALVFAGLPVVLANATSALAVLPGYLGGAIGYRPQISLLSRQLLVRSTVCTVMGGAVGAILLLISSNKAFSFVVPFLLLAATLIFAFRSRIQRWTSSGTRQVKPGGTIGVLAASIYGGYFNGGLGIVQLALFSLWGMRDLNAMNALKSWLSFALSLIAATIYASAGMVAWPQAILMMVFATLGGYAGTHLGRSLPPRFVSNLVIATGGVMSAVFFYRLLA
jgi:uncharacterized membrane protein YfcA